MQERVSRREATYRVPFIWLINVPYFSEPPFLHLKIKGKTNTIYLAACCEAQVRYVCKCLVRCLKYYYILKNVSFLHSSASPLLLPQSVGGRLCFIERNHTEVSSVSPTPALIETHPWHGWCNLPGPTLGHRIAPSTSLTPKGTPLPDALASAGMISLSSVDQRQHLAWLLLPLESSHDNSDMMRNTFGLVGGSNTFSLRDQRRVQGHTHTRGLYRVPWWGGSLWHSLGV